MMDKEHKKSIMNNLHVGLPKPEKKHYIKANTIANKAISTKYGYTKDDQEGRHDGRHVSTSLEIPTNNSTVINSQPLLRNKLSQQKLELKDLESMPNIEKATLELENRGTSVPNDPRDPYYAHRSKKSVRLFSSATPPASNSIMDDYLRETDLEIRHVKDSRNSSEKHRTFMLV